MIEAKQWIRGILHDANLGIDGNIYIDKKPTTDREDIVINSITSNDAFFQANLINVNCYVPDIQVNIAGKQSYMPNTARLREVHNMIKPLIRSAIENQKYSSNIEFIRQEQEEAENTHYINFRLRVNAVNY